MKKFSKIFVCILASIVAVGCSDDSVEKGMNWNGSPEQDQAYLDVKVSLPTATGSRSHTTGPNGESNDGIEVGKDYENKVNTLMLVLASKGNGYIAHSVVGGLKTENNENPSTAKNPSVSATAAITLSDIARLYNEGDEKLLTDYEEGIRVYVFCNPTQSLINEIEQTKFNDASWVNAMCEVNEDVNNEANTTIWSKESFLMSNADANNVRLLPTTFKGWDNYTTAGKPFNLTGNNEDVKIDNSAKTQAAAGTTTGGAIKVERSVARFDFRDASKNNDYTYDLEENPSLSGLKVKLERMIMVNMSKKFYYLRRVSNDGYTNPIICGGENEDNYVVDWDAEFKANFNSTNVASLKEHFNYQFFNDQGEINDETRTQWYNYDGKHNVTDEEDNDDSWNNDREHNGYRIWRYVTENTIPSSGQQKNGISTGVIFKGKLLYGSADHAELKKALNGEYNKTTENGLPTYTYNVDNKTYPILYLFQNTLYVGWNDEIKKYADAAKEGDPLHSAVYEKKYNNKGEEVSENGISLHELYQTLAGAQKGTNAEKDALAAFRKAATSAGFTLYQASTDDTNKETGYYFYYYYWNRHNDNSRALVMGPMEFAVVRNNVYKLAVTSIRRLGHPRIGDNDPDKPTPETPDEKGDVYLTVDVQVLPWVVRINNIEF